MTIEIYEVDATTGKKVIRPMTDDELKQYEKDEADRQLQEQALAEKEALKQSANEKLAALGLTPDEILAITGA